MTGRIDLRSRSRFRSRYRRQGSRQPFGLAPLQFDDVEVCRVPHACSRPLLTFPCRHMNLFDKAEQIEKAILSTIAEGKHITGDLGGKASTSEFTNRIISKL